MSDSSRRGFLKVAGAGVAVAGVAAVAGNTGSGAVAAGPDEVTLPRSAKGSVVAHVHDVRTGEMSLLIEDHEITITDKELAARIASALHKNSPRAVNHPAV